MCIRDRKQKVFRAFGRYHGAVAWFADRGVWNNPPRTVGVIMTRLGGKEVDDDNPVSYTHLDVYKRQV